MAKAKPPKDAPEGAPAETDTETQATPEKETTE
jgi:hypothetical protein